MPMTTAEVRSRYKEMHRAAAAGDETMNDEQELMLDVLEAIASGDTPRPRLLAKAVIDEYRNFISKVKS